MNIYVFVRKGWVGLWVVGCGLGWVVQCAVCSVQCARVQCARVHCALFSGIIIRTWYLGPGTWYSSTMYYWSTPVLTSRIDCREILSVQVPGTSIIAGTIGTVRA
jgi:hypothetical protein